MSSSNSRPQGDHRVPRRGGRTLTKRVIRIESERRSEIDLHYLGQALLRLAQEQYDVEHGAAPSPANLPDEGSDRAHVAHTGPNGPPRGYPANSAAQAPVGRLQGATE